MLGVSGYWCLDFLLHLAVVWRQWERPEDFVPIVRENPYATTPEQDFIKSVLSPKRSKVGVRAVIRGVAGSSLAAKLS